MKDQKRTRRKQPLSETPDVPANDPWKSLLGPEYVCMDFSISGAEQRWEQILAWVHAKLPRNYRPVWPFHPGEAVCTEDWAPRYGTEKVEAERLQDVLTADRAETIEAVLEKWATTLEEAFHLRTKEEVSTGRAWAELFSDIQHKKRKSPSIFAGPHIAIDCYAWKYIVLQRDSETCKLVQEGQQMVEVQAQRLEHLREIAPQGGKATAHYTVAEVTVAFTDYKARNPGKSAWDAASALIRKGEPLDRWKHQNSAWNRIERIADEQLGITRQEWFDNL